MRRTAVQDERNGLVLGMHRVRRGAKTGVVDGRCIGWFCRTAVAATDCLAGGVRRNRADPAPDGRVRQVGVTHVSRLGASSWIIVGKKCPLGSVRFAYRRDPMGEGRSGFGRQKPAQRELGNALC